MRFDYMLGAFLIISLFVLGGVMIIGDMNSTYSEAGVNISDDDFGDVYNTIDEIYEDTDLAKDKTLDEDIEDTDSWESMTKGSYSAIRLITGSFGLFHDIANAIADKLKIPDWIVKIAFIMFALAMIFSLIYMIFRYTPN